MTAQRSRADVDRLYTIAVDRRRTIDNMVMMCKGPVYGALLDASRALDYAIMEYYRPITLERTFNALRDAVKQAEATIDKYRNI